MERAARLKCAKCGALIFWMKKRNVDNSWLFEKCRIAGVDVFEGDGDMTCSRCGTTISIPLDILESMARTKGVEVDPDREIDLKRI